MRERNRDAYRWGTKRVMRNWTTGRKKKKLERKKREKRMKVTRGYEGSFETFQLPPIGRRRIGEPVGVNYRSQKKRVRSCLGV